MRSDRICLIGRENRADLEMTVNKTHIDSASELLAWPALSPTLSTRPVQDGIAVPNLQPMSYYGSGMVHQHLE